MQTQQLGNTGISVSAIGLGAMPLSLRGRPPEAQAIRLIHRALEMGVTFIDTADSYCQDESDKHHNERLIYKALQQYSGETSQVIVATKGGLMRPDGAWTRNGSPDHLRQTIQDSFEALGGEKPLDVWQYHSPDPDYSIADSLAPVKAAVEKGLIRFVGVSNFSVEQIQQAREVVNLVSVQNQYNLLHRQPEQDGVLEYCQQEGLTFLPYRPLGGRSGIEQFQNIETLKQLAQQKGISIYQVALAWLRAKFSCVLPIPGASQMEHLEDSIGSINVELSESEVASLDSASALVGQTF